MLDGRRKCPYCNVSFAATYIQRHLRTCLIVTTNSESQSYVDSESEDCANEFTRDMPNPDRSNEGEVTDAVEVTDTVEEDIDLLVDDEFDTIVQDFSVNDINVSDLLPDNDNIFLFVFSLHCGSIISTSVTMP